MRFLLQRVWVHSGLANPHAAPSHPRLLSSPESVFIGVALCRGVGIDLGDIVQKEPATLRDASGKRIAFDAWNILYQFLSNIRQPDGTPLKDKAGNVTSHLAGILYRTSNLVDAGIKPVFVFDGTPHPLKQETLAARAARREQAESDLQVALDEGDIEKAFSKAQQTSKMTPQMAEEAKELLGALGIPVVDAPSEGEAQAAVMCHEGEVDGVCSQDFDALLFGAPQLWRNLTVTGRRKLPGKQVWINVSPERIDLEASLEELEISQEQLIDIALLVGTDFHPGIKGVGPKKALQTIKKEGDLESLLDRLGADPESAQNAVERSLIEQHEALRDRDKIRAIFLEPEAKRGLDLSLRDPDKDAVLAFMVDKHDFAKERVEGALRKFEEARGKADQQTLFDF